MSRFGTLWRRAPAFKSVFLLAAGLSALLAATLYFRPIAQPLSAPSSPAVGQSRFTAPARPVAEAVKQAAQVPTPPPPAPPANVKVSPAIVARPPAPGGSSSQVIAPTHPNVSLPPPTGAEGGQKSLMGKTLTGQVQVQGRSVPLSPGEWIVVAHFPPSGEGAVESLFLAQLSKDTLSKAVVIQASRISGDPGPGFRRSAQCGRTALLYAKTLSNEDFGSQDCWTINHNVQARSERDTPSIIRAAIGELETRGVKYPPVMLSAFFRLADKQRFLNAIYYFNPESDGIASSPTPIWDESDWHRNYIRQYPDKVAYADKLRSWAEAWHPQIRDAFESPRPAPGVLPGTTRQ